MAVFLLRTPNISAVQCLILLEQKKCEASSYTFTLLQFQLYQSSWIWYIWCSLNRVCRHADEKCLMLMALQKKSWADAFLSGYIYISIFSVIFYVYSISVLHTFTCIQNWKKYQFQNPQIMKISNFSSLFVIENVYIILKVLRQFLY